jgi:hypothetical protein
MFRRNPITFNELRYHTNGRSPEQTQANFQVEIGKRYEYSQRRIYPTRRGAYSLPRTSTSKCPRHCGTSDNTCTISISILCHNLDPDPSHSLFPGAPPPSIGAFDEPHIRIDPTLPRTSTSGGTFDEPHYSI